jgi:ferrous-iron efflux pump FieF
MTDSRLSGPAALMRRAAIASVSVSLFLVAIKGFAYFTSHSVAVLASLADSALDLFTAMIQAVNRILAPEPLDHSIEALLVMCIAILCAIGLILYERRVVARTGSVAIAADQTHYLGDLATNIGVVVALLLSAWLGWLLADPVIAILVAAVMAFSAWGVGRQSLDQLMDRELPDAERARIRRIALAHHAVRDVHDLKTRAAGLSTFIQLHLELDPNMALKESHAISDAVEKTILAAYPGAEVIIHQDPVGAEPGQAP